MWWVQRTQLSHTISHMQQHYWALLLLLGGCEGVAPLPLPFVPLPGLPGEGGMPLWGWKPRALNSLLRRPCCPAGPPAPPGPPACRPGLALRGLWPACRMGEGVSSKPWFPLGFVARPWVSVTCWNMSYTTSVPIHDTTRWRWTTLRMVHGFTEKFLGLNYLISRFILYYILFYVYA